MQNQCRMADTEHNSGMGSEEPKARDKLAGSTATPHVKCSQAKELWPAPYLQNFTRNARQAAKIFKLTELQLPASTMG